MLTRSSLLLAFALGLVSYLPGAACQNVLAYYTNWSKYAGYGPAQIPYNKLTHICHAFIWPNANGTLNVPGDYLEAPMVTAAHAAGVKVLASLGGASQSGNFAGVASNAAYRATFVAAVKNFVLSNNYDGVDFDWEFPVNATDRSNFTLLVSEIRTAFNTAPDAHPEWLITGAYSWTSWYAQWYDLPALTPLIDFFNIMTYDAHGSWSPHTGHNAPLGASAGDPDAIAMTAAVTYYTSRGVPVSKINFGVPFYGYDFPLENIHQACGCGAATGQAYKDIAPLVGVNWTRTWDAAASSPYLRHDSLARFLSYDDPQSIQAKADWALNTRGLAGVFMWEISQDYLGPGMQPLLDAMRAPLSCGTPTFTSTPSRSSTPSPTRTATLTRTATPSATPSRSPTPSPSATASSSTTGTGTPSQTRTATPSATPSSTSTGTGTASQTRTSTPTLSPTPSVSPTPSPSATPSSSASATSTASGSPSASPSPSASATLSPSPSASPTSTDVPPGSTATSTATLSPSASPSPSASATVSLTATPSPSATLTCSPTSSASGTPSATQSSSASTTPLAADSATATATPAAGASATATVSPSSTPAPSASGTPATATPAPDGEPVLRAALPQPNPNPSGLLLLLEGRVDEGELKLYSAATACVARLRIGALGGGWQRVALPPEFLGTAPNGVYFYRVDVRRKGGSASKAKAGTFLVAR